ncbi:hypothetical protein OG520_40615 (plasmid) [Streptomyces sp. NBC_00984]|uniref:hypothetical protein n=1 Tax=Streptomyces sp. NBC_00984 TaxID=2903700 RepID=UPI002F909A88|nr:hypothetical protein OG520_40615 [Streptomyces sp. NBC_00984]
MHPITTVYQADHRRLLSEIAALRQAMDGLRLTAQERQSAEGELCAANCQVENASCQAP